MTRGGARFQNAQRILFLVAFLRKNRAAKGPERHGFFSGDGSNGSRPSPGLCFDSCEGISCCRPPLHFRRKNDRFSRGLSRDRFSDAPNVSSHAAHTTPDRFRFTFVQYVDLGVICASDLDPHGPGAFAEATGFEPKAWAPPCCCRVTGGDHRRRCVVCAGARRIDPNADLFRPGRASPACLPAGALPLSPTAPHMIERLAAPGQYSRSAAIVSTRYRKQDEERAQARAARQMSTATISPASWRGPVLPRARDPHQYAGQRHGPVPSSRERPPRAPAGGAPRRIGAAAIVV